MRRLLRWSSRRHLELGNAARDRRDWPAAIRHYDRYLNRRSSQAPGVLVQLGHALKEHGRPERALTLYERAVSADENDMDALRHLAFLQRSLGRFEEARRSFERLHAVERDPAMAQMVEWMALGARRLDQRPLAEEAPAVVDLVQSRCQGVRVLALNGLVRSANDTLLALDHDPWIEFDLDLKDGIDLVRLRIDASSTEPGNDLRGRLYIDHGKGFSEAAALGVSKPLFDVPLVAPSLIRRIRWDPEARPVEFAFRQIRATAMARAEATEFLLEGVSAGEDPTTGTLVDRLFSEFLVDANEAAALQRWFDRQSNGPLAYARWRRRHVDPDAAERASMAATVETMPDGPLISIVMPVFNPPPVLLAEVIDSILAQNYPHLELCIADDCSPNPAIREMLRRYEAADRRVKLVFREENGHISAASNSALSVANGEFVALVDHDDLLPFYALFVVMMYIKRFPDAAIFFSDEDKVDERGVFHSPYMKGSFNRELMYGHNMVSHLGVYRRELLVDIGGFRMGFEGSQDYDLFLRCLERIDERDIVHIPHVLYHWRTVPGSTSISHDQKSYAIVAAQRAISEHLCRIGIAAASADGFAPGVSAIAFSPRRSPTVSVVVLTRDRTDLLKPCIGSIEAIGDPSIDLIVVDNGSTEPATADYLADLTERGIARVLDAPEAFNFSALNNRAASIARGEILCFLNNDTELVSDDIFSRARAWLEQADIGIVGARLLYPDGQLQHFGLGLGMAEHRVAMGLHVGLDGTDPGYFGKARLSQEFSAVTAACLFTRTADFHRVGGFDVDLPVAYNDVDLCLRYRAAGLRVVCDGQIVLVHKESRSRGADREGAARERLDHEAALMRKRWAKELDEDPFLSPNHSLDDPHFSLADPPRQPVPWRWSSQGTSA